MKKVISAAIYQMIQFDDEKEFQEFILKEKAKEPDGKVTIKIMKQYNNNKFIERGENNES